MVGTLPVAPVQLPISRSRTYIRFNHLDSSLVGMFKYVSFSSGQIAVSANSSTSVSATVSTIPDDYTPIAIGSITTGNHKISIGSFGLGNGNTISFNICNGTSSNSNATIVGKLLCVPTNFTA